MTSQQTTPSEVHACDIAWSPSGGHISIEFPVVGPPIFRPPATQAISHYPQMSIESILCTHLSRGHFRLYLYDSVTKATARAVRGN